MVKPRISVIIPTYNRSELLRWTLTALNRQTAAPDQYEIIVADDGSEDDLDAVVRSVHSKVSTRLVRHERDGFRLAAVRNLGSRAASGDAFMFIDCGIELAPDAIAVALTRLSDRRVLLGAVTGYDPERERNLAEAPSSEPDPREQELGSVATKLDAWRLPWRFALGLFVVVPRGFFDIVRGYDERFAEWGMEDLDFAFRLHLAGCAFSWIPSMRASDRPHPRPMIQNLLSNRRNQLLFVQNHQHLDAELFVHARRNWLCLDEVFTAYDHWDQKRPTVSVATRAWLRKQYRDALDVAQTEGSGAVAFSPLDLDTAHTVGAWVVDPSVEPGSAKGLHSFGLVTPYTDKQFELAIVGSLARSGPPGHYAAVLAEARRVASIVIENPED